MDAKNGVFLVLIGAALLLAGCGQVAGPMPTPETSLAGAASTAGPTVGAAATPSNNGVVVAPPDQTGSAGTPGVIDGSTPAGSPTENTDDSGGVSMNGGNGVSMSAKWSVSGYVLGPNATWTDKDAQALVFKTLDITDTEINYDGQICRNVTFKEQTVKPADYLPTTWKITPQALSIDAPEMQVIKTNCNIPGFGEYMRVGIGRLIVPINGVFFFFDPLVTY